MKLQDLKEKFSKQGTFAKNSFFLFCGSMIANIFNYIFHLVIGRQVSVGTYGEAESLISLVVIVSVPAATLAMVATKYAAACKADGNKKGSREIWIYLNKKVLKFGLPIFLLMILLTPIIGKFLNIENNLALIAIWIVMYVSFFNSINNGFLSGWQKFKKVSLANALSIGIKLLSGILLVGAGFALGGIVGSLVLSVIALYLVTFFSLRFRIIKKTASDSANLEKAVDFNSLKHYVLPVFTGNLAITILGNADMVLAKHNLDDLSAGQYGALTVVSKIIFFATGVIASVLFSMSAENSHKGDSSYHILKTAVVLILAASLGATTAYFMYPTLILSLLYGNKYQSSVSFLGWFAIAVTLYSLANVIFQYLLSIHKTKISYILLTISLLMVLFIVILGGKISDIISIVIAAQAASMAAGFYYVKKLSKVRSL